VTHYSTMTYSILQFVSTEFHSWCFHRIWTCTSTLW